MKNEQNPHGASALDVAQVLQKVSELLADETRPYEERVEEAYNTYYAAYEQANETGCPREDYMKLLLRASEFMYNHQAFEVMLCLEGELLEYYKEDFGEKHIAVASRYHNIGVAHKQLGNYDQAMEYLKLGLETKLAILEENDERILYAYFDIADLYLLKEEYDKALEYYEMLYEKAEAIYGHNHMAVAEICNKLSTVHSRLGNDEESWKYSNWSMEISLTLNPGSIDFGMDMDDDDTKLQELEADLQQKIEEYGENHIEVGNCYNAIGTYCHENFEWEKAFEYHEKALQIRLAAYGENHLDVAESYFKAGKGQSTYGTYEKAKEYLEKSLEIQLGIPGANQSDIVDTILELKNLEMDSSKCIEYLKKALEVCETTYDENDSKLLDVHRALGLEYQNLEMNEEALEHHLKALKIGQETFRDNESLYESVGNMHMLMGDFNAGLENFLKAKEKAEFLSACILNVGIYNKIGQAYQSLGEYETAITYHQKAIKQATEQFGETYNEAINGHIFIGIAYESMGNIAEAIKYYEKGIPMLDDNDPDKEEMLAHLEAIKQ